MPALPEISSSPASPRRRGHALAIFTFRHPWLAGVLLLLLFTLGLRLFWGWRVSRALSTVNQTFLQRGEALDPEDVRYIPIPDDQNAWALIQKAAASDTSSSPSNANGITLFHDYPTYPPYPETWRAAAQQSEVSNAPGLDLARKARQLRQSQVRIEFPSLIKGTFFRDLTAARRVADTVGDSALYNHLFFNDDFEAVERLRDLMGIGRAVSADDTLIGVLVAAGIDAIACQRTMVIAPGLRFDRQPTRGSVMSLIRELLDESRVPKLWADAMAVERLLYVDYTRYESGGAWALQPLAQKELVYSVRPFVNYGAAASAPDAETCSRMLEGTPSVRKEPQRDVNDILAGLRPKKVVPRYDEWYEPMESSTIARSFIMRYRTSATRRVAAVSLAIRLFRADHDDRLPQSLDELVPAYLPAVPKDPFHADGRPLAYVIQKGALPDGRDRPLVSYDEGSSGEGPIDTEPMYDLQRDPADWHRAVRQYRDMSRWSPVRRRFDIEEEQRQLEAVSKLAGQASEDIISLLRKALGDNPD